jgi:glycosyltransferase involved in cell wall biosynthesis
MPRVSMIVPTFNRVGYLEETIASILNQDYCDFELVVADNASTDGTAALIGSFTDPRLRHVRRERNIGWRANFNQALQEARSEYVALVCDDDRLLPGALTRAVGLLDEAPAAGFVHTTFHIIDDGGEVVGTDGNWSGDRAEDRIKRGSDFIVDSMRLWCPVRLSSAVMRTAALPEVCFEAADQQQGDVALFLRIALDWDVAFLASPGVELRDHPAQLSIALDERDRFMAICDLKLRFMSDNAARLEHMGALRRAFRRFTANEMSIPISIAARESRAAGFRELSRALRCRPQLLLAPRIWRTSVKLVVGPRILRSLRDLRSRRRFQHR